MKKNVEQMISTSEDHGLYVVQKTQTENTVNVPPENDGRADARELREFLQSFLSINNKTVRRQFLNEVKRAALEEC